jgi:hypothetical protein
MNSPRQSRIHKGEIEALLDRLCNVREELLSIERSLERIQVTKPNDRDGGSGKHPAPHLSTQNRKFRFSAK